jgi:hypothetical protein
LAPTCRDRVEGEGPEAVIGLTQLIRNLEGVTQIAKRVQANVNPPTIGEKRLMKRAIDQCIKELHALRDRFEQPDGH